MFIVTVGDDFSVLVSVRVAHLTIRVTASANSVFEDSYGEDAREPRLPIREFRRLLGHEAVDRQLGGGSISSYHSHEWRLCLPKHSSIVKQAWLSSA